MGYKVDYGAMQNLLRADDNAISEWKVGISDVMAKIDALIESTNYSGNSADRMREYLGATYRYVNALLPMLLEYFRNKFLLYSEGYYNQIDAARDTRILDTELSERCSELRGKRNRMQQIGIAAESAVKDIWDLVATPSLDIGEQDALIGKVLTSLDELDGNIYDFEAAHVSGDFAEIDELIAALDTYLQELTGLDKEHKANFTSASFASLASVPALTLAANKMYDQMMAQKPEVAHATKHLQERLKFEQEEYERRKKQAEWAKIGVGIAVGIISAAVVATTGPVGAVAVGAISGALTSAFSVAADQYAEKGWNIHDWDKDRIVFHAGVGAITGAAAGAITQGLGTCAKSAIKGISSAVEGGLTTSFDQVADTGSISDVKAVVADAAKKGLSTFAGNCVGGVISQKTTSIGIPRLDLARDDPLDKLHDVTVFGMEGLTAVSSGIFKRGSSEVVGQTLDWIVGGKSPDYQKLIDKMYSPSSMTGDMIGDGIKGNIKDYNSWHSFDSETHTSPIIQYKLGNTPDPETGTAPIVDMSLYYLDGGESIETPYFARFPDEIPNH